MSSQRSEVRSQRSDLNARPSVELRIEELVLHGFAPDERYAISDAVECELARLLRERGVPISLESQKQTDEVRGPTFNTAPSVKPPEIGQQVAQSVYQGFSQ